MAWYCVPSDAPRGVDRNARPQAREQVRPIVGPARPGVEVGVQQLAHRDGHVHGRPQADRRPFEVLRRDADDGEALAVDDQLPVEDRWILSESRRPIAVPEDHDARLAHEFVVIRIEQPSESGPQLQDRKITAGHEQALAARRLRLVCEVCGEVDVRRDVREDRLDLLQVAEHGVAEDDLAVARSPAVSEAGLRTRRAQVHELRRTGSRDRLQQHLMEHGKNAGCGADAERERDDSRGREGRPRPKQPDGVAPVAAGGHKESAETARARRHHLAGKRTGNGCQLLAGAPDGLVGIASSRERAAVGFFDVLRELLDHLIGQRRRTAELPPDERAPVTHDAGLRRAPARR